MNLLDRGAGFISNDRRQLGKLPDMKGETAEENVISQVHFLGRGRICCELSHRWSAIRV